MSQHGGGAQKDKEEKRQIILTYKALHNKVESKLEEADKLSDQLKSLLQSEESREQTSSDCLSSLEALTLAYDNTVQELVSLYKQDKNHELEEGKLAAHEKYLNYVNMVVKKIKNRLSDKLSETSWPREQATKATRSVKSTDSRRSRLSSSLSTSSTARLRALSEAAAAKKEAEYERAIAQRKLELKRREIEYEHEIAFLSAAQKEAVAYARLEAIDEALLDDPEERKNIRVAENNALSSERVSAWVNASENSPLSRPHIKDPAAQNHVDFTLPSPQTALRPPFASTAIFNDITGSQLVEALTLSNEHIVSGLARQSLPKCHPDVFGGDPTLFHPWKAAFKAMIQDANVSPQREINYLHKYTSGEVQQVVDNFRKRIQSNPVGLLSDVWKELEKRFGSAAVITNALLSNLLRAAEFKENEHAKLQRFADVCADVDSQISHLPGLACLNFPNAIAPIVGKLPASLKGKWEKEVVAFAEQNDDRYPSFSRFKKVIERQAKIKNHPNLSAGVSPQSSAPKGRPQPTGFGPSAQTLFTNTSPLKTFEHAPPEGNEGKTRFCHFHQREGHTLSECKAFGDKTLEERSDFILKAGLCFKCLSENCRAVSCKAHTTCSICGDKRHIALLHKDKTAKEVESVEAKCTTICSGEGGGLSCSKIVLVDLYSKQAPNSFKRVYAVLDDQSNASLISSELADELGADGPVEKYYLSTCSGERAERYGRRVNSIYVRSLNGYTSELPTLVECESIPSDRREIPTPQTARRFPHLCSLASEIQPLDDQAGIHLLIGRDAPELLKVREFRNGPRGAPWAQRHSLGWTISGQVCLDMTDGPKHVRTNRTTVNAQVQVYSLEPCPNAITVKESFGEKRGDEARRDVFHTTQEDNEPTLSREDKKFLELMESGIHRNASGNWEMPLPFRDPAPHMPNNRSQAESRLKGLLKTLKRKPDMQNHYIEFMSKVIGKSHASPVPPAEIQASSGRVFYLSHFGVYHPKKPGSLRVVFDSSLEFRGVSLNKALIPGPDQMNSLLGVLMRFRKENVAVMCDVEQMFHSFHVNPEHRDFLRFLWFKDNDPSNEIIEYRMNVHLFGNGPSPAIATFGLRKTVNHGEEEYTREVKQFVNRNFYVDDGLASVPSAREAIDLVEETQTALATRNLRLHKVVSNVPAVVEAFPADDRAKDIRDLDLRNDALPVQRSLGVHWDLEHDSFTFKVSLPDKPFTRRGVLAVVNSVYDPLGLAAPAILEGRKLLQNLVAMGKHVNGEKALGWDDPLPEELALRWTNWKDCLKDLESVSVPRCYKPKESWDVTRAEVHAFSDASKNAIGAAVYLRLFNDQGETSVSLVYGQAKVAPIHPTSIPRLELCGAVLATEAARKVTQELDMEIATVKYYTDSKVVLGYIKNDTRRFHVYVANRVQTIRNLSQPDQWEYVESSVNPADQATRGLKPDQLMESSWIKGPDFLRNGEEVNMPIDIQVPDEADPEVRREITAHKTSLQRGDGLGTERFSRFSSLTSLQRALARLITKIREFKQRRGERSKRVTRRTNSSATDVPKLTTPAVDVLNKATTVIVREVQRESFARETEDFNSARESEYETDETTRQRKRKAMLKQSRLYGLDPFLDDEGVLRVGGRLRRAELEFVEKHPALLPKDHHVSRLVIDHYHRQVHHQGRQLTGGAVRQAGYWIIGAHGAVAKVIRNCVACKKLRGPPVEQRMADLPVDRTQVCAPFTSVGFDVFGPWKVCIRKTRGGAANSKRWGLVFTCLSSRAIHIEVLESMDASAFICALRRFFALRGHATLLRCDRGTNFIGAKTELEEAVKNMDKDQVEKYVTEQGCSWEFNPPHASHFGGVWERQINTIRRVLDAMFAELGATQLTHELLVTLMAEVVAIVNARPISAIPTEVDNPQPLSPAMLLTMKSRPAGPPPGDFLPADIYARRRWRRIQYLADNFWSRWRREYLQNLQHRQKWCETKRDLQEGDVVLVRDEQAHRNAWPMGRVTDAVKSKDGRVRKAVVMTTRDGERNEYFRPVKELILLMPVDSINE